MQQIDPIVNLLHRIIVNRLAWRGSQEIIERGNGVEFHGQAHLIETALAKMVFREGWGRLAEKAEMMGDLYP